MSEPVAMKERPMSPEASRDSVIKSSKKKHGLMDNLRLAKDSDKFMDSDTLVPVVRQCFMLMAATSGLEESGFTVSLAFNVFDDPAVSKVVDVKVRLDEFIVEAFPDLIKNLVALKPEFANSLKGGFVSLPQATVRKLQHHAAIEHFKSHMFRTKPG